MQIDEILHIAKLSRLKLSEEEIVAYQSRFTKILEMINSIADIQTHDIKPMRHPFDAVTPPSMMRADVPSREGLILTSEADPYFYVPKVIET